MGSSTIRIAYLLADAGIVLSDSKKGCSIHARSMIRAFQQEDCAVTTFTLRPGRSLPGFAVRETQPSRLTRFWNRQMIGKKRFRLLAPWRSRKGPVPNWADAVKWLLWNADFHRQALRRLRPSPPQILYARHAWLCWPYARLKKRLKAPLVLEVNAVFDIEKAARGEGAFPGLARRIEKAAFEAADLILPVSAEIREQILAFGIDPRKVVVTPNAVDLELFAPKPSLGRKDTFRIGCVSSFRAYHGLSTLVQAAARLKARIPGIQLVLIGDGPEMKAIGRQCRGLGLEGHVEFPGVVDHMRVPALLRGCDVCVCPNEGEANQYNCPMKLFEYMALKVPVVASRWGDIPNILRDGETGLLHAPGDPDDLARALLDVYEKPQEAARRVTNAYGVAQERSWRANAKRVLEHTRLRAPDARADAVAPESARDPLIYCGGADSSEGWANYFMDLFAKPPAGEDGPAQPDSRFRILRHCLPTADLHALADHAAGRTVVSLVASARQAVWIHNFLAECRDLLDEGRKIHVLLVVTEGAGETQALRQIFKETFSAEEGLFAADRRCARHTRDKIAFGRFAPDEPRVRCQRLLNRESANPLALRALLRHHLAALEDSAHGPDSARQPAQTAAP